MEGFRQSRAMFFEHGFLFEILRDIVPLVRISLAVVEFFGAVVVADIAMGLGNDGDVAGAETSPCHVWPIGFRVFEQRFERVAN